MYTSSIEPCLAVKEHDILVFRSWWIVNAFTDHSGWATLVSLKSYKGSKSTAALLTSNLRSTKI